MNPLAECSSDYCTRRSLQVRHMELRLRRDMTERHHEHWSPREFTDTFREHVCTCTACMIHAAVHYKRDKKWLLHSDLTTVTSFAIAVKKQFQPLRDHLGRPIFQLGPTHAASVKQHLR